MCILDDQENRLAVRQMNEMIGERSQRAVFDFRRSYGQRAITAFKRETKQVAKEAHCIDTGISRLRDERRKFIEFIVVRIFRRNSSSPDELLY